jgi:hypothetical protein
MHLDLQGCNPDYLGADPLVSDKKIRSYHLRLKYSLGKNDSEIIIISPETNPQFKRRSSIDLGQNFVATGHYDHQNSRVFLDILVDNNYLLPTIANFAEHNFLLREPLIHNIKITAEDRIRTRDLSETKEAEITEEKYSNELAFGLSTHFDLSIGRNNIPENIDNLVLDEIFPPLSANPPKISRIYHSNKELSFVRITNQFTIYGLVLEEQAFIDVLGYRYYSGNDLRSHITNFFGVENYTFQQTLRK